MKCSCATRNNCFEPNPDEEFSEFLSSITKLDNDKDYDLCQCNLCKQLYVVEPNSRGPLVVKVASKSELVGFNEVPYRKEIMIKNYGGTSDTKCIQAGCRNKALNNMAFCIEHAFDWSTYNVT